MLLRTGNLSRLQSFIQFLQCTWTHTFLLKINRFHWCRLLIFIFLFFGTGYWLLSDLSSYKVIQYSALPEQTQQMLPAEGQQWVLSRLLPIWIGCYWGDSGAASQNAGNVSHLYPDCIWTVGFIWWVMCPVLSSCADFLPASPVGSVSRKAMLGTVPSVSGVRQQGDEGATSLCSCAVRLKILFERFLLWECWDQGTAAIWIRPGRGSLPWRVWRKAEPNSHFS